eukprot:2678619-Pyramimonas_sp.AAC.3
MQETPDAMPEGETPHTVNLCLFDNMVDNAKPGDRVEVTGIYRAVPIKTAPNRCAQDPRPDHRPVLDGDSRLPPPRF